MFYQDGLHFECQRCSGCCRHEPGYVFFSEKDLISMYTYLEMSRETFLSTYVRTINLGITTRLSLLEKPNNDCIFWEESGCRIYSSRPLQCRSYPFWPAIMDSRESWIREGEHCPGIGKGPVVDPCKITEWLAKRERENLL